MGLLVGGGILAVTMPEVAPANRSLIWVGVAGGLVGYGTRLGNGCTSGHGVCGSVDCRFGLWSPPSHLWRQVFSPRRRRSIGLWLMNRISAFVGGILFAIGLGLSGMTDATVIGFKFSRGLGPESGLCHGGGYRSPSCAIPPDHQTAKPSLTPVFIFLIDRTYPGNCSVERLFSGGMGLGGFCPGPGLVSVSGFGSAAAVFVAAMIAGMLVHRIIHRPKVNESTDESSPQEC